MDVKIKDGDIVLNPNGTPVYTEGIDEVLQRVVMCITADRGGFIYNKDMGSAAVTDVSGERERRRLEALLREAILPVRGAELYLDSAEQLIDGRVKVSITVTCNNEDIWAEVIL